MADRKRRGANRDGEYRSSPSERPEGGKTHPEGASVLRSAPLVRSGTGSGPTVPTRTDSALQRSEAKLRKASELVGLAVFAWDPLRDTVECDDNLRAMWGMPSGEALDRAQLLAGIHNDDHERVEQAIAASLDPAGSGRYDIEYRVIGRDDGVERWVSASAQTTFEYGSAVSFIGAAVDITERRTAGAAIQTSEARFRAFAQYSANLLWIVNPSTNVIEYRSPAYERIWGEPVSEAPATVEDWLERIHLDDRHSVLSAFATVESGELVIHEYRIIRPDGSVRKLRDTSFPIRNEKGQVTRVGGIAEDLTVHDGKQVYMVATPGEETNPFADVLREAGFQVQRFDSHSRLLEAAAALAPGCVVVDLRGAMRDGIRLIGDLTARSVSLPTVIIGAADADPASIVAAMKAGATDYLISPVEDEVLIPALFAAMAEMRGLDRIHSGATEAVTRVAHLTRREREVLEGLIKGGTNKTIGRKLGISPRTVEVHRSQVMNRLDAGSLSELIQTAVTAGLRSPR